MASDGDVFSVPDLRLGTGPRSSVPNRMMVCPECGRTVGVYGHPSGDGGEVLAGHRETMPHASDTPWCPGGGRRV